MDYITTDRILIKDKNPEIINKKDKPTKCPMRNINDLCIPWDNKCSNIDISTCDRIQKTYRCLKIMGKRKPIEHITHLIMRRNKNGGNKNGK